MTAKEVLYAAYCQLRLLGYTHEEIEKIVEEIEVKMKKDKNTE